jgi:hypothetical protein
MSRFEGPQGIVTNGLVLNLDAGDPDSYTRSQPPYVEVLVVAGGGGGGAHVGGGGGAGGLIYNTAYQLSSAAAVTVTIGGGGTGASPDQRGGNGSNSVFGSLTAIGGGGGGTWGGAGNPNGLNGGSGGGAAGTEGVQYATGGTGTAGQGNSGGNVGPRSGFNSSGVGGGGAGGGSLSRADASDATQINGGSGLPFSILGTTYFFAGGGGPGAYSSVNGGNGGAGGGGGGASTAASGGTGDTQSINAASNGSSGFGAAGGAAATNSGGGGGAGAGGGSGTGGAGGSGIVIVRYPGLPAATGGTITYVNGYTIHTFTSSGTFTPYPWNDISGNNNSGSLINGVGFNSYQNGGYLSFDGVDDRVATSFKPSGYRSYFVWIKYNITSSLPAGYSLTGTQEVNAYNYVGIENGGKFYYYFGTNGESLAGTVLSPNTWYYQGLTLSSDGYARAYINGMLVSTLSSGVGTTATNEFSVGCINQNHWVNGSIGSVVQYNRALSQNEIIQNFNAQKNRFGVGGIVTNGLVTYVDATNISSYPGSGTTWYDLSGNGNNFTFSSTPNMSNGLFDSEASVYAYRNAIAVDSSINGYTLEACFKLNSSTGGGYQNITQNGGGDPTRHMMWYNGGSNTLQALFHTPNFYNNVSDTLSLNTWYYVQLSYNPNGGGNNGRRAWINGVEKTVNNTAAGNATPSGYFTISVDSDLVSNKSDTSYAFVRYYNRALSTAEIAQNYMEAKSRFGI